MRPIAIALFAALLLTGCASLGNTPQQEMSYAAWAACQADGRIPHTMQLRRVEPDGRWWWEGYGQSAITTCMAEQFDKMRRGTLALTSALLFSGGGATMKPATGAVWG
jgi:hypothetical protein